MINYTDDVKISSSFSQKSKPYGKIENRANHGFIFRTEGRAEYFIDGKNLTVNEGEVIFLPKSSRYEYKTFIDDPPHYTSINFEASLGNPQIAVYSFLDFYGANYIAESFSELWKFGTEADKFKCLSIFYDFLSYVLRIQHISEAEKNKYSLIEPAIEYLKKHVYDSNLRIEKLHNLCGISDTYFRKIFISRFSLNPQEYVLRERITHAKSIIESGDFDSIREVALSVGFNDALYFSKAFKKFYGFSPSKTDE